MGVSDCGRIFRVAMGFNRLAVLFDYIRHREMAVFYVMTSTRCSNSDKEGIGKKKE